MTERERGERQRERKTAIETAHVGKGQSVNWSFEPCQPQGIISGLRETFINKIYT